MQGYEELESKVMQSGICTVCGACVSACPLYYIQIVNGVPRRPKKKAACKNCGVCFNSCYKISDDGDGNEGDRRDVEGIGRYMRIASAKWNGSASCQDGGIVTAVLRYALELKLIDGAVLTFGKGWMPVPGVARCADDFDSAAGTKFGISPVLMHLRSAVVEHGLNKLCIVGTPCHIRSVKHLMRTNPELSSAVVLTIGLFCSGNFAYQNIAGQMEISGLRVEDVDKVGITNGKLSIHAGSKRVSIPVSDLKNCVPHHCNFCGDYSGELADISVGSEGSEEGWSTVVIRSEKGAEVFSELERTDSVVASAISSAGLLRLIEVSEKKRKSAKTDKFIMA